VHNHVLTAADISYTLSCDL